ncbi:hypothetical protein FHS26_006331 [Rhizobium pisi]|uniref:DUF3768 domain-containing protein n=1 Tax=Rhizobium pisi TaxID=574561 RepID=A0A427M9F4_9HYPH|nr:DUF3768 domain-containing protein [Rhizobium pisi]MBB3138553.1 hypothetical protein [Rhizobium pisi]RSB62410.1 DUF3768 domain-containing protein [Rhizobium pisi]TCA45469.1 DUF3768 domain-containing protein [Rhizobium pisi]
MTTNRTKTIRILNDAFRRTWLTGEVLMTPGIGSLSIESQSRIAEAVQTFDAFTADNDPHGEHDFGAVTVDGTKVFWKIDYYAMDMLHGSEDPADPKVTKRVLTIMLAEEY